MPLSGMPYAELRIDAHGAADPGDVAGARDAVAPSEITDAVVLAHGWNTNAAGARGLYRELADRLAGLGPLPGTALVGVIWPSTRFADPGPEGGAAGTGDLTLGARLTEFAAVLDDPDATVAIARAAAAVSTLTTAESARRAFTDAVRDAVRAATAGSEKGDEDVPAALFTLDGAELIDRLARPARLRRPRGTRSGGAASIGAASIGGATGGAAGLDILGGIRNAARNLLDVSTYYVMKERAGTVGARGLAPILAQLHAARPGMRIHLVGHSFGARLVAAAATDPAARPVASMTLLQGAFSHFGFAQDWKPRHDGAFRGALTGHHIEGPVLVTHTANDRAVGIAYALASRVAGQVASTVGGPDDDFGGIGRNGALRTPEAHAGALLDIGGRYDLRPGVVHNLLADAFVPDHSAVTGPQVAHALRSALAVGAPVV